MEGRRLVLIRKLRVERGWSQETLADISGLSVRTIQRLERGGNASLDTLGALAAAFEVDVATLAEETSMYAQKDLTEEERRAVAYVRDIKAFYSHLATYVVVIAALALVNLFSDTERLWFLWPLFGWGIGVAAHGLSVFEVVSLFDADWEKRQIRRRLDRNRSSADE